jgi:hypothetical protein
MKLKSADKHAKSFKIETRSWLISKVDTSMHISHEECSFNEFYNPSDLVIPRNRDQTDGKLIEWFKADRKKAWTKAWQWTYKKSDTTHVYN